MRKFAIYNCVTVLALLALAYVFAPPYKVSFTQAQIKTEIAKRLPKDISTSLTAINVKAGTVDLRDDNRIAITTQFDVQGFTLEGEGAVDVVTRIRYDDGRFFLTDFRKENLQFIFSDNSKDTLSDVKSTFDKILKSETNEAADTDNTQRQKNAAIVTEYVETQLRTDANAALDKFMQSMPIYSMNTQGGAMRIAALALKDVAITGETVTATLTFQTLIQRIVGGVVLFLFMIVTQFWRVFTVFKRTTRNRSRSREPNGH